MSAAPFQPDERFSDERLVAIKLTPYQWHQLLETLDDQLAICNRRHTVTVALYEDIATQLSDRPVKVIHRDNADPEYRPKVEPTKAELAKSEPAKPSRWWSW